MANRQYTGDKCENCVYSSGCGELVVSCIIHKICEECSGVGHYPGGGDPSIDCEFCHGGGFQNKIDMAQITKELDELFEKMQTPEFKKNMDEFGIYLANKFKIP